ncbi:hypothetical protein IU443_13155 [Nocardia farcinica]|uniref:hypothetical protein n=1 Tax=Nocardia farcinica TaxID=37329 RepID=UPI001893D02B|nr:hypothetical protein [Nocardia farcinica]MBF6284350.1 hypothetical protein [Nocardia farcinica]MBF6308850.1 hypothetical protein [Nocardia farcinica]MBF6390898.1 hypothetical protein [Nocardia farcinica]MBF6562097.1 hypothetical protein [Nocardia farcinica]MBF6579460.1 hypothetical protein [Nocardia farcinica]
MRIATLSNSLGRPAWARACAPHAREWRQFVCGDRAGRAVLPAPAQVRLDYVAAHPGTPVPRYPGTQPGRVTAVCRERAGNAIWLPRLGEQWRVGSMSG